MEFFHAVSKDYHRSSSVKLPKNTANRPTSLQEVSDKLQQRALTLVTGGINGKRSSRTETNKNDAEASASKKRKRNKIQISRKEEVKLLNAMSPAVKTCQTNFLDKLNRHWNDYVRRLVRIDSDKASTTDDTIARRLQMVANDIEWVGARMRIDECLARPQWAKRQGILVATTSQTWKVIESTKREDGSIRFDVLIVPKKGTYLTATFRMPVASPSDNEEADADQVLYIRLRPDGDVV
jgi:hypothetical protein